MDKNSDEKYMARAIELACKMTFIIHHHSKL